MSEHDMSFAISGEPGNANFTGIPKHTAVPRDLSETEEIRDQAFEHEIIRRENSETPLIRFLVRYGISARRFARKMNRGWVAFPALPFRARADRSSRETITRPRATGWLRARVRFDRRQQSSLSELHHRTKIARYVDGVFDRWRTPPELRRIFAINVSYAKGALSRRGDQKSLPSANPLSITWPRDSDKSGTWMLVDKAFGNREHATLNQREQNVYLQIFFLSDLGSMEI